MHWILLGILTIPPQGGTTAFSTPTTVSIRYLRVSLPQEVLLVPPQGVWIEDSLPNGDILFGILGEAQETPWEVRTVSDTWMLFLGDTLSHLDLKHFQLDTVPSLMAGPPPPQEIHPQPTNPTTSQRQIVFSDTLSFTNLTHLSPESRQRLNHLLQQMRNLHPRKLILSVTGIATPEGDPALNRQLARWRALEVTRKILAELPAELDVKVSTNSLIKATGRWAIIHMEVLR